MASAVIAASAKRGKGSYMGVRVQAAIAVRKRAIAQNINYSPRFALEFFKNCPFVNGTLDGEPDHLAEATQTDGSNGNKAA